MERLAGQADELERVVQEQQTRLEELDLLLRQRDEQLAQQQSRVGDLEAALHQREEEVASLRALLSEREAALSHKEGEISVLRSQLAEREAAEAALREELARVGQGAAPEPVQVPLQIFVERFGVLEDLVNSQGTTLAGLRTLIQDEMVRLHTRLDQLEARLEGVPAGAVRAEAPVAVVEVVAPEAPLVAAPLPAVAIEVAEGEDPIQAALLEALENLPLARIVGMAGRDGLSVESVGRGEQAADLPLEVELAELTAEAVRVAAALGAGPLLTLAFQAGDEHCLLSPIDDDHFAFVLTPAESPADFRFAQAVLLQTASHLREV
jgi:predicted regulator of Ras-like GTPase activity (Roadblock/LC7/MglB family)